MACDSSVVTRPPVLDPSINVYEHRPRWRVNLGKVMVGHSVALGALQAATNETFLTGIPQMLKEKCAMIPLNEEAFTWGIKSIKPLVPAARGGIMNSANATMSLSPAEQRLIRPCATCRRAGCGRRSIS